jgi:hypothetical protein
VALPLDALDRIALTRAVQRIGRDVAPTTGEKSS